MFKKLFLNFLFLMFLLIFYINHHDNSYIPVLTLKAIRYGHLDRTLFIEKLRFLKQKLKEGQGHYKIIVDFVPSPIRS